MDAKRFNELIKKIKTSREAYKELYIFYYARILIFISRKYKYKDLEYDVAQQFFTKILEINFKNYIENPTAYVYGTCDNIAKTFLSNEKRYNLAYTNEQIHDKEEAFKKVLFGEFYRKLDELDKETKSIIIEYACEGYTLKEIADKRSMNYNTVRQKYSRGIKNLRK